MGYPMIGAHLSAAVREAEAIDRAVRTSRSAALVTAMRIALGAWQVFEEAANSDGKAR